MLAIVKWVSDLLNIICRDRADNHLKIESAQYKQEAEVLMTETHYSKLRYWNLSFNHNSETLKIENRIQLEAVFSRRADDN